MLLIDSGFFLNQKLFPNWWEITSDGLGVDTINSTDLVVAYTTNYKPVLYTKYITF